MNKRYRQIAVREGRRNGKSHPSISLSGKWLQELGYEIGATATVTTSYDGSLAIRPERERAPPLPKCFVEIYLSRVPSGGNQGALISSPDDIYKVLKFLSESDRERFVGVYLDAKNRINCLDEISKGTLTASLVHPREVYKAAILTNAASVIIAHNHPSGDPRPSREDIELTERLIDAGKMIGIELLDHVIVGNGNFESLRETGYL